MTLMAPMPSLADAIEALLPGRVQRRVPIGQLSRWRIGGAADLVVRPRSIEDLSRLRAFLHGIGSAHVVIGSTSNLLFDDAGLRVPCIQIGSDFARFAVHGTTMVADPGLSAPRTARLAMSHNLSGIAHICGIPGSLGGLVCMNGGSQRKGIGSHVSGVTSVAPDGTVRIRDRASCGFAYRSSVFQTNGEIIAGVTLDLEPGAGRGALRREMLRIMGDRRRKFPKNLPNCGSVFVSNPAMYVDYGTPGEVIERLGFKGHRIGDALVSPQHANFIVNAGAATARDTLALISEIRDRVHRETGYLMEVEALFVAADGTVSPACLPAGASG